MLGLVIDHVHVNGEINYICKKSNRVKKYLLIALLFGFIPIHAQTLISLPGKKSLLDKPNFYIAEIIDARSNKETIGVVQKGLTNQLETAQFANALQKEFQNSLGELRHPHEDRTPLLMRILKINVFERTLYTKETAIAEVVIEFYTKTGLRSSRLVKSTGSTVITNGIDVTRSHGKNIERCLALCLHQVNVTLGKKMHTTDQPVITDYSQLFQAPTIFDKNNYRIFNDTFLVKGVYKNVIEFRENSPGIMTDFSLHEKTNYTGSAYGVTRGEIQTAEGKEANVWGYSDGKQIFIKLGEEFFPLFVEDDIFWFEGYDVSNYKLNLNVSDKSVMLGVFTGYLFFQVGLTWDSKRVKYAVNLGNGDLIPLN